MLVARVGRTYRGGGNGGGDGPYVVVMALGGLGEVAWVVRTRRGGFNRGGGGGLQPSPSLQSCTHQHIDVLVHARATVMVTCVTKWVEMHTTQMVIVYMDSMATHRSWLAPRGGSATWHDDHISDSREYMGTVCMPMPLPNRPHGKHV
jgi:hypothetical protein